MKFKRSKTEPLSKKEEERVNIKFESFKKKNILRIS